MSVNRLNLDNFPNSAYAHELRRGLAGLRFEDEMEAEYRIVHLQRMYTRVRIWFSMSASLAILFTIAQVRSTGIENLVSILHVTVLIPCSAVLAWLVWSRYYERFFMPAAPLLVALFSALIAAFVARAIAVGHDEQLAALTVNLIAVFFFAGLMFRQALLAAAIILFAFTAAAMGAGMPAVLLFKSLVVMVLTTIVAALVYWDVEQAYRRSFLEGALIGELVARDGLSGLMNRRAFDDHLGRVWQHALRDRRSVALLMIDIDFFKRYNDDHGHQAGDLALRSVAQVIQGFARRPLDLAARYGGEEFAVILYDLALAHVQDMAERLREGVEDLRLDAAVTVSIGVGLVSPALGRTSHGAVQLADEALYEAKRAGRNRVVVKGNEAYNLLETGKFKGRGSR